MCLAVPMKIVQINGEFGIAELGGLRHKVNLQLLPQIKVGDYIIVHAGFGIEKLDAERAEETLRIINEIPR
jgi:hydrogenase expression/formation protein HypC